MASRILIKGKITMSLLIFSVSAVINSFMIFSTFPTIIRVIRPSPSGRIVIGDSLVPEVLKRFKDVVNEVRSCKEAS